MRHPDQTNHVLALLARLGWQRNESWNVPCRDAQGRRSSVRIAVAIEGVRVDSLTLTPLQVGRLRGALADAVVTYAQLRPGGQPAPRDQHGLHAA
jgi:hypothetical protein